MDPQLLNALLEVRKLSQSDLARAAGISRQAVSIWFNPSTGDPAAPIDPRLSVAVKLSSGLGVELSTLTAPFPISTAERTRLSAALLWDGLYPSLNAFCAALLQREPPALARLVQVYGFFEAEKIVGKQVWREFPRFKRFIIPARARQCEQLWKMQQDHKLI